MHKNKFWSVEKFQKQFFPVDQGFYVRTYVSQEKNIFYVTFVKIPKKNEL
jgi:hypothetical protein